MTHEAAENVEKLPPGVVSIKPPPRFGMFGSMLIRMALGVLLLGAGVVAVYYSIKVHSDDGKSDETAIEKTYFSLNRTQYCLTGGIFTQENHTGFDAGNYHIHHTIKLPTQWAQVVESQRLYFSIGTPFTKDWVKSYYVFPNHTITATPSGCVKDLWGYDEFLTNIGLGNLLYIRSEEIVTTPMKENGEASEGGSQEEEGDEHYTVVNFFQGDPSSKNSYQGEKPFLGLGYMDSTNSKAIAWQVYFEEEENSTNTRYFEEFWYPGMQNGVPLADVFSLPEYCIKDAINPTPAGTPKRKFRLI